MLLASFSSRILVAQPPILDRSSPGPSLSPHHPLTLSCLESTSDSQRSQALWQKLFVTMALSGLRNELKSQVAVEAAQDPNSSITADDAQNIILKESQKAGSTALHFDPNASPEEKAAQARSV